MSKFKFEEQFRAENPQTIGEADKHYDLENYKEWLEEKLSWIPIEEDMPTENTEVECKTYYHGIMILYRIGHLFYYDGAKKRIAVEVSHWRRFFL